jgi:hypothetical protein
VKGDFCHIGVAGDMNVYHRPPPNSLKKLFN